MGFLRPQAKRYNNPKALQTYTKKLIPILSQNLQYQESDFKDIVFIEPIVEFQVFDLDTKEHVDSGQSDVI